MINNAQAFAKKNQMSRGDLIRMAFYHGDELTLANPSYMRAFRAVVSELLRQDSSSGDLTVEALSIQDLPCAVEIRAKQAGVIAGLVEASWLYEQAGAQIKFLLTDGSALRPGDIVLRAVGRAGALLSLERTAVNLLQRMAGIATLAREFVDLARSISPTVHVVGTRKTLWGLLDKRALACGGAGTHRLNLSDAVLIKTDHLRMAAARPVCGDIESAIHQAWKARNAAKFIEVEVTTPDIALRAATTFAGLQIPPAICPHILMLDNFSADDAAETMRRLRSAGVRDSILIEASGNISKDSVPAYAASGVDAISVGALTHSVHALDLSATTIPEEG